MLRASLCFVTALGFVAACSSDSSDPTPASNVESNQPGGGNATSGAGGNESAGRASGGTAAGGTAATPEGNDEGTNGDISLAPGAGGGSGAGDGNDEGAAGTMMAAAGAAGSASTPVEPGARGAMSFFVTSRGGGNGGDFDGIEGADALCAMLAAAAPVDVSGKTWHAYLSTSTENARDRIGAGPWVNAAGVTVANSVAQLHDQGASGEGGSLDQTWPLNDPAIALDEQGNQVQAVGGTRHDIITGSNVDGTVSASGTCNDWTSQQGTTRNGHSDRVRFMQNIPAWNSSHDTGCAEPDPGGNFQPGTVSQGGGRGSIYCFAID
jgi:hypothetical protein